jgi:hypothetical protein
VGGSFEERGTDTPIYLASPSLSPPTPATLPQPVPTVERGHGADTTCCNTIPIESVIEAFYVAIPAPLAGTT